MDTAPTGTATDADRDAPLVTLVTTVHDGRRHLAECLASVAGQTLSRWRLVLVDDGSEDGSREIAAEFAATEPRCALHLRPHQGRVAALRYGHAQVRTRYVAWVDADDRLHPDALALTVHALESCPWAGMVYTRRAEIGDGGERRAIRRRLPPGHANLLRSFFTFHFRLLRREVFEASGGVGRYAIAIDYDLCLRMSERAAVLRLDEPLYDYRRHRRQMSVRRRRAQVDASARAIREAIERRGLADHTRLELVGPRPRFVLRSALELAPPTGPRRLAAAYRRWTARDPDAIATARLWPDRGGHLDVLLRDGLHRCGVAVAPTPRSTRGLLRASTGGRGADLLVLGAVGERVVDTDGRLSRSRFALVLAAVVRARAEGCRVVWCDWEHPLPPSAASRLASLCHEVVRLEPGRNGLPPFPIDWVPQRDRSRARRRLGLRPGDGVIVAHGSPRTVRRWLDARGQPRPGATVLLHADAGVRRPDVRVLEAWPRPSVRLDAIAAADLVLLDDALAPPWGLWCDALGAGRRVHAPGPLGAGLAHWLAPEPPEWLREPTEQLLTAPPGARGAWRDQGQALRRALRHRDPARFCAELIGCRARASDHRRTLGRCDPM